MQFCVIKRICELDQVSLNVRFGRKNLKLSFFIFIGAPVEYFGLLKKALVVIPSSFFFFA